MLVLARRHLVARHVVGLRIEGHFALLGDRESIRQRLGVIAPDVPHLFGGLHVVAVTTERKALAALVIGRLTQHRARLHTQQRLMCVGVFLGRVVKVVRGDKRRPDVLRNPQEVLEHSLLDVETVVHQLHVERVAAKNVLKLARGLERLLVLTEAQTSLHLSRRAASGRDDALGVALQEIAVHTRLVEVAFERCLRAEPEQVVHARGVPRPHRHVGVGAAG